jgi:phosphatidylglycerol---prolipoprotein diacylglyceryl transferase
VGKGKIKILCRLVRKIVCYIIGMFVHNISRIALEIGPVEIRWYSLMFATGVVLCYFLTRWLWKREKWPLEDFDLVIVFLFFGLVIGARLGEVLFYNPSYYFSHPVEIFKIWKGGLASHGATIGLFLAYVLFWAWRRWGGNERRGFAFRKYIDILAVGMPMVAGFVRIGNFFNSEIVGRKTDLPWGVVFGVRGESFARHPSQIYEALLAWGVFAVLLVLWLRRKEADGRLKSWVKPYLFMFLFIALYFLSRFGVEFLKEYQVLEASGGWSSGMTMGQVLSVIPVLIALVYFVFVYPKHKN